MEIIGYTDRLSVSPGETVQIKASTTQPAYRVDIVRLTHPFRRAEPERDVVIDSPVNGERPGRSQAIESGERGQGCRLVGCRACRSPGAITAGRRRLGDRAWS